MVVAALRAIRSPRLQPHLGGNIERHVGVVWSSRISSNCGYLQIVKELHRQFFLLLRLRDGCGLLDPFGDFPSATNNVRPTQEGAAAAAHRWHGLEVEDEGLLTNFVVIFVFLEVLCTVYCFYLCESPILKKSKKYTMTKSETYIYWVVRQIWMTSWPRPWFAVGCDSCLEYMLVQRDRSRPGTMTLPARTHDQWAREVN
jgi:hypothetical protein